MYASLILLVLIAISSSFCSSTAINSQDSYNPSDCRFDGREVVCDYMMVDNATLERMLANGMIMEMEMQPDGGGSIWSGRRLNVAEIAPFVQELSLNHYAVGDDPRWRAVSIRPGTLATWTNLTTFKASGLWPSGGGTIVYVPANELAVLPRLKHVELRGVSLSENALKAIGSVSDRLEKFVGKNVSDQILSLVANMTNLKLVELEKVKPLATSTLRNSASSLVNVRLYDCDLTMIRREMFRGMSNLTELYIVDRTTRSMDEDAFDDLINVEKIDLFLYSMRRLPQGLFDKLNKLHQVGRCKDCFDNLSRANFTHVEDFEGFVFV